MSTVTAAALMVALTAAYTDLRWRRIPNWLTLGGLALGLALHWADPSEALKGAAVAFAVHLPLFALRALGGGDVKLMSALGAIVGPWQWLTIFALNAVLGGLAALILIWRKRATGRTMANTGTILAALSKGSAPEHTLDHPDAIRLPRGAVAGLAVVLWAALVR